MEIQAKHTGIADAAERQPSVIQQAIRTWAGYGSGDRCDLCNRPIGGCDIEYEVELRFSDALQRLRFHLTCYRQWATDIERPIR